MNSSSASLSPQLDDVRRLLTSAQHILDQPPPPTLREILSAYKAKGDGDRDMLLSMLNAKTAEDQRLSSTASLYRSMLDIYSQTPQTLEPMSCSRQLTNGAYSYPTPSAYAQSPRIDHHQPVHRVYHHHRDSSRSRSPHRILSRVPRRDTHSDSHTVEHSRKRRRSSRSPHSHRAAPYEPHHPSEQLPPSPYSSSERSDSGEYSPRSRSSMTIGNLLSTGSRRDSSTAENTHDRD